MPSFLDYCPYQWFTINLLRPAKCKRGGTVGAGTPLAMVWPLPPTWRSLSMVWAVNGLPRRLDATCSTVARSSALRAQPRLVRGVQA
jgi:hypothetical protein